jgi:hypothetical protein
LISESDEEIYTKKELAIKHFNNYLSFYKEKNYVKSSEFLWGTINDYFYAIGLTYNKKLSTYGKIEKFLSILIYDYHYDDIIDQYKSALLLHSNFYQNFLEEEQFDYYQNKVLKLIDKLSEILDDRLKKSKQVVKF